MNIKTLFLGSNWEALATLKTLHEDDRFDLVGVITQPDKPVGRKKELKLTEIKQYALDNGIEVFHTLNDANRYNEALELYKPELIITKSYGEIIPESFLMYPKYKSINVHFSLLPKYRGAVPIQAAIMNGDKITGITIVQMVKELDAGPILAIYEEEILPNDTNLSLRERLVIKASQVLPDLLEKWVNGDITPTPQDDSQATFCWQKDISKEAAFIEWEKEEPERIINKVKAMIPWPITWTLFGDKRLKIFEAELSDPLETPLKPGVFKSFDNNLYVGTNNPLQPIKLISVQLEGKDIVAGSEFVRGRNL